MVDEAQMAQTELFVCSSEPRYFTVRFCSYSFPGITLHDEPVDWAAAGDHVSLTLTGMDIIKIKWAKLGFSLSNGLFLMKSSITITLGYITAVYLKNDVATRIFKTKVMHITWLACTNVGNICCMCNGSLRRILSVFILCPSADTSNLLEPFSFRLPLGHFNCQVNSTRVAK